MNNQKEYRDLGPDEVIQAGDEFQLIHPGVQSWTACGESQFGEKPISPIFRFRRPITPAQGGEPTTISVCQKCGGLYAPNGGSFAGTPCRCSQPSGANPATDGKHKHNWIGNVCSECGIAYEVFARKEIEAAESLRAENEGLKHKKAVSESVARAVSIRLTNLQSQLAAERKKREEADTERDRWHERCAMLELSHNQNFDLRFCLQRILDDLPVSRDWFDPQIERLARETLKEGRQKGESLRTRLEQAERERDEAIGGVEKLSRAIWEIRDFLDDPDADTPDAVVKLVGSLLSRVLRIEKERDTAMGRADFWMHNFNAILLQAKQVGCTEIDVGLEDGSTSRVLKNDLADTLKARVAELEKEQTELINAVLKKAPTEGAWESDCPLCGSHTECGAIGHRTGCALLIASHIRAVEFSETLHGAQARQALGEKETHIAPPAESAHTSIKEKTE